MLLTEQEVAERIRKSLNWLQHARQTGVGPPYLKIGHAVRYRDEDVDAWLEAQLRQKVWEFDNDDASEPVKNTAASGEIARLRLRLLKMSKHTRASRTRAYHELMRSGWSEALLDKELDDALRWAHSAAIAAEQQAEIKRRAVDRARMSNDAALENMFAAGGVGRENIINEKT